MTDQSITEEQASFLATLPNVFCDLPYAIRIHAFVNRVAVISEEAAREAIAYGLGANVVETDGQGQLRLADRLRRERVRLEASEGNFECAVDELSKVILNQAESTAPGE